MSPVKHLWQICTDIIDTILHHQVNEYVLKDSLFSHIFIGSVENKHFWSLAFTQCTWREGFKKIYSK